MKTSIPIAIVALASLAFLALPLFRPQIQSLNTPQSQVKLLVRELDETTKMLRITTTNLNHCLDSREHDQAMVREALVEATKWKTDYETIATNSFLQVKLPKLLTVKLVTGESIVIKMLDHGSGVEILRFPSGVQLPEMP